MTSNISDVGRTSRCRGYESEKERQEINESTGCAEETSQFLLEKQAIVRCEDLESDIEPTALDAHSPIQRLSNEVLCHIFDLHCKDSLPATLPRNHHSKPVPPQITLSHICSAWREIMLDVPTFWSSIRIVPRKPQPETIDTVMKVANRWLSRAKGLPCSIDVDFPEDNESCQLASRRRRSHWEKDWHEKIIRDLISLHKFRKLGVTFADHHLQDLLQLPDDKLSCVEDLCLRYLKSNQDEIVNPPSSLDLHKLSNLTSFSLLPFPNRLTSFNVQLLSLGSLVEGYSRFSGIPWHNLRHIQLRVTMPAPFCLDALEHSSAILETCSLVINGDHTFTSSPRVPVHLFQLRELEVEVCPWFMIKDEEILEFFLLSLRLPRLKSLTLGPYSNSRRCRIGDDVQMLLRVQIATRMHLEELILSGSTLRIDVRTLLSVFPSLRRLALPNTVTFTDEAMIEVGAGSIGTFLEDLTIPEPDLNLKKLLQMVKARLRAGDRDRIEVNGFKRVTLYSSDAEDHVEDDVRGLIEEIKRSGVDLNVVFIRWDYPDSR